MSHKKTVAKNNKQAPVGSNNITPNVVTSPTNTNAFTPLMGVGLGIGAALLVFAGTAKWGNNSNNNTTKVVPSYSTSATIEATNNVVLINNQDRKPNSSKTLSNMEGLSSSRTVFLRGAIYSSRDVVEQITALSDSSAPIYLFIDSPGGSVFEGEKIISAMESAKGPVNTVCIGLCASMAAYIHQYGTQRYAYDRAILMFHDGFGGLQGEVEKMNSMLSFIRRKIEKIDNHVSARSGLPLETYLSLKLSDLWIDAEDAQAKGLVDKLVKVTKLDGAQGVNDFEEKVKRQAPAGNPITRDAREALFPFNLIYTPQHQ